MLRARDCCFRRILVNGLPKVIWRITSATSSTPWTWARFERRFREMDVGTRPTILG